MQRYETLQEELNTLQETYTSFLHMHHEARMKGKSNPGLLLAASVLEYRYLQNVTDLQKRGYAVALVTHGHGLDPHFVILPTSMREQYDPIDIPARWTVGTDEYALLCEQVRTLGRVLEELGQEAVYD